MCGSGIADDNQPSGLVIPGAISIRNIRVIRAIRVIRVIISGLSGLSELSGLLELSRLSGLTGFSGLSGLLELLELLELLGLVGDVSVRVNAIYTVAVVVLKVTLTVFRNLGLSQGYQRVIRRAVTGLLGVLSYRG